MPPKNSPRAYLLWGPEELKKREFLQGLIEELVPPEDRELDVQYVDPTGPGVTGEAILHAARDRAMFSEHRVVVVLNAGRLRGPRHQRTQDVLADGLAKLPDYSTLVLLAYADEGEGRSRTPLGEKLMAALKTHGAVKQFSPLKPDELAALAAREAADAGKKIAPAAASMLAQRIGADSRRLVQEVRKLAAYIGERPSITPQDVSEMVAAPPDDNVYHLLDATMKGDRRAALDVLRQLRQGGVVVYQLLPLLARMLRQVAQAKYLQDRGVPYRAEGNAVSAEVMAALPADGGLYRGTKDWQRGRLWDQARRITWEQLHFAFDRLAVVEAGTKGWEHGVEDPDLALELYVASLCASVQAEPPSAERGFRPRARP